MTPFIEQQAIWEQISNPSTLDANDPLVPFTVPWPAMGPVPNLNRYQPWVTEIPTLRCPSDPGVGFACTWSNELRHVFGGFSGMVGARTGALRWDEPNLENGTQ